MSFPIKGNRKDDHRTRKRKEQFGIFLQRRFFAGRRQDLLDGETRGRKVAWASPPSRTCVFQVAWISPLGRIHVRKVAWISPWVGLGSKKLLGPSLMQAPKGSRGACGKRSRGLQGHGRKSDFRPPGRASRSSQQEMRAALSSRPLPARSPRRDAHLARHTERSPGRRGCSIRAAGGRSPWRGA